MRVEAASPAGPQGGASMRRLPKPIARVCGAHRGGRPCAPRGRLCPLRRAPPAPHPRSRTDGLAHSGRSPRGPTGELAPAGRAAPRGSPQGPAGRAAKALPQVKGARALPGGLQVRPPPPYSSSALGRTPEPRGPVGLRGPAEGKRCFFFSWRVRRARRDAGVFSALCPVGGGAG